MNVRIGTCSICNGAVMGFRGVWMAVTPPPPGRCASCGAVEGYDVVPMAPLQQSKWDREYFKNMSEAGQRLKDLLALREKELAAKDEEIARLRQKLEVSQNQFADASTKVNSPENPDSSDSSNNSNGWISVKDRLPENKRPVIYWHDEFGANVGYYDSTYPKPNYHWWSYNFGDSADFRVKWWMPLPEPPKEEK